MDNEFAEIEAELLELRATLPSAQLAEHLAKSLNSEPGPAPSRSRRRYTTTTSNANRKRANTISRVLLCNDYLKRPIEFDRNINLLDEGAVQDALQTDPACVNCHNSMDPIASYFFGFFSYDPSNPLEVVEYHPERELLWKEYIGAQPAWYGTPGHNLSDLGQQIAGDPRFVECAVEQAWVSSLRREALPSDADALTAHREAFLAGDLTWKALMLSLIHI